MQLKLLLFSAIVLNLRIIFLQIHTTRKNIRVPLKITQNQLVFIYYDTLSSKYTTKEFWVSSITKKIEIHNELKNYTGVIKKAEPNFKNNIFDILNFKS